MTRVHALAVLLLRFVWQVLVAGATTAWVIVRPGRRPAPALVRIRLGNLSPTGASLLACLITLTPGTTAIDIDLKRRSLLLHLLDGESAAGVVAAIRQQFERYLEVLCPERRV